MGLPLFSENSDHNRKKSIAIDPNPPRLFGTWPFYLEIRRRSWLDKRIRPNNHRSPITCPARDLFSLHSTHSIPGERSNRRTNNNNRESSTWRVPSAKTIAVYDEHSRGWYFGRVIGSGKRRCAGNSAGASVCPAHRDDAGPEDRPKRRAFITTISIIIIVMAAKPTEKNCVKNRKKFEYGGVGRLSFKCRLTHDRCKRRISSNCNVTVRVMFKMGLYSDGTLFVPSACRVDFVRTFACA